jgi:diguanylate cyclase (GGDEF)-like protein/PAS domain S-box-containing protein
MTATVPPTSWLLDALPDAVCVVDPEGRFLYVNRAFEQILGYPPDALLGRRAFELVHPDDVAATQQQAARVMAGEMQRHFRNRYRRDDGGWVDIQWSARWDPEHGVRVAIGREVTELRRAERELEHLAAHDALTGLHNRHRLQRELQLLVERSRVAGDAFCLLYIDLDGFKQVNDRGGHDVGDKVLRDVALRLRQGLRQSDVLARMGGDEFVALLPGCGTRELARKVGQTLRARLQTGYPVPDATIELDASVGVACFPADGGDPKALLSHADRDMYAAKRIRQPGRHQAVR